MPGIVAVILRSGAMASSLFMFLCIARIFMSWLPSLSSGSGGRFIERATEPYLSLFRRIAFLRSGSMDFSPIAALAVLAAVSRALSVASYGALSVGFILALIVQTLWSPIAFLLSFFAFLALLRIIAYKARWNSLHPAWRTVDAMVNPVLFKIKLFIYKDRIVNYMQGLVTGFLALAGARVAGGLLIGALAGFLGGL